MIFSKKIYFSIAFVLLICSFSFSQGVLRGKISDENGEPAINAILFLKSNPSVRTAADFDGNYSLKITDSTAQTLVITYLGHDTIQQSVRTVNGEVVLKNFSLALSGANVMKEVQITAKAVKAKDYYMEQFKMNSSVTVDYISSETMKKTGDANVVAAVARVSGVSTNNGGLITVRGIGDRYIKTTINGSRVPTLDPFTNNIKLDLFPSTLIDNIIITKTASPDLPGDWAGAYLSVETKDFPEKLTVNAESSVGYNTNTSFKEVLSSERSSTDWLGYDNGFRNTDHTNYGPPILKPSEYQEMSALNNLAGYFQSLGVNSTSWNSTYFNLGLVQLGLIENSQLGDPDAIASAIQIYNTTYKLQAFDVLNEKGAAFGQSLPNNWNTVRRKAPLNFSQSFSIGSQTTLFKKSLGYIAGFRYGSSIKYDPGSYASRISIYKLPTYPYMDTTEVLSETHQQNSVETNGWSALMNVSYKLSNNHSISLLFMPNIVGVNNVREGASSSINEYGDTLLFKSQFYEERKQMVYQYKSEHFFPKPKLKIELNASYTFGNSSAPDFKNLQYLRNGVGDYLIGSGTNPIQRLYRYLTENMFDSRISAELPLSNKPGLSRKLKFGGAYQRLDRASDQYEYTVLPPGSGSATSFNGDITQYLDIHNFGITSGMSNGIPYHSLFLSYTEPKRVWDHNIGYSDIKACFAMVDYSISRLWRASGGLRVEDASIYTDALKYDTLGYDPEDPRRAGLKTGSLNTLNYLPSANIIYKLKNSEEAPINLRLNYSRTVARPTIRELSGFYSYDYQLKSYVVGNGTLEAVRIDNYDLRCESYFKSGDNISISLFYKNFLNHIELINSGAYTWQNVDASYVKGIELEGKKNLLRKKNLELRANVTFVDSRSEYDQYDITYSGTGQLIKGTFQGHVSRTMYGQAPYVINGMISYRADSIGLTGAVSYNLQGRKLVIPGLYTTPDVYENPRHLLDAKITKTIGKHFAVNIIVRDILNSPEIRYFRKDNKRIMDYDRYRYGTNYNFTVSYKL